MPNEMRVKLYDIQSKKKNPFDKKGLFFIRGKTESIINTKKEGIFNIINKNMNDNTITFQVINTNSISNMDIGIY